MSTPQSPWVREDPQGRRWFAQRTEEAQDADTWVYPRDAVHEDGQVLWLQPDSGEIRLGTIE